MTPDQQRIKIAETCGWLDISRCSRKLNPHPEGATYRGTLDAPSINYGREYRELPHYLNDLNAMHEAEGLSALDQNLYSKWLWVVVTDTPIPDQDPWDVVRDNDFPQFDLYSAARFRSATAAQRAKAFLLTFDSHSFSPPPATPPNANV